MSIETSHRLVVALAAGALFSTGCVGTPHQALSPQSFDRYRQIEAAPRPEPTPRIADSRNSLSRDPQSGMEPAFQRVALAGSPEGNSTDRGEPGAFAFDPAKESNEPNVAAPADWRLCWHGGTWWYWMPSGTWRVFVGGQWLAYVGHGTSIAASCRY